MATLPPSSSPIENAVSNGDAAALAAAATQDELVKLKLAEELIQLRAARHTRSRFVIASQALVGYIALAGFFVNAYQSFANQKEATERSAIEQSRWSKEFDRAALADKYRAFFETSLLATDAANQDKRLVGYALMEEFVDDKSFNRKATLMLEEKLSQELRTNEDHGLDEAHRATVVAILSALSQTPDCKALERAAGSIERVARRHAYMGDKDETAAVFYVYVDKVIARAVQVCDSMADFRLVRLPIRETLRKFPEIDKLNGKVSASVANREITKILIEHCDDEVSVTGVNNCPSLLQKYLQFCKESQHLPNPEEDDEGCQMATKAASAQVTGPQ